MLMMGERWLSIINPFVNQFVAWIEEAREGMRFKSEALHREGAKNKGTLLN